MRFPPLKPGAAALALAVGWALLGPACGDGAGTPASPGASVTPGVMREVTREMDGVRLKLSVDREKYEPNDSVKVKVVVENTNDRPVEYTMLNQGDPAVKLSIVSDLNGEEPLRGADEPEVTQPVVVVESLGAGKKIEREVSWDQRLNMYQTAVQAPPGRYTIRALFLLGEYAEGKEPASHTAAVTFEIEGSEPVLAPDVAIQKAMAFPEVKDWVTERDGSLVCAVGNRGLFYNVNIATGETFETFDFLYRAQVENGLPICSPVTEGDTWRVIFFGGEGEPPQRLSAFVDLNDGTPVRVEEGGPEPSVPPTPAGSPLPTG